MKKTVYSFLVWRILLFLPLFVSQILIKPRSGFEYTSLFHFLKTSNFISNFLLYPWANFDGIYYLAIAKAGYTVDTAGFFPLYPLLVRIFSIGDSSMQFYIGLILSSIFFLLGLIVFSELVKIDYKENIVFQTVLAILVFPTSFYFAAIYSESLFFLFLVLSLYFARRKNWVLSSIFGILLTSTRIVGIAILPALLLEFYLQNKQSLRPRDLKQNLRSFELKKIISKKIIPIFLTPLGLVAYSWFNFVNFGNPLQFVKVQGTLLNNRSVDHVILFPQTVFRYFRILTSISPGVYEWWVALIELSSFIFAVVLLYIAWKKRIRTSYILFGLIALLIPASSGTFSGLPRYVLVLFPIFITLALINNKLIKITYFAIGVILLIILFALFSKGFFIS